jgi:hypothetical protein
MKNKIYCLFVCIVFYTSAFTQNNIPVSKINFVSIKDQTNRVIPSGTPVFVKNKEEDEEKGSGRKIERIEVPTGTKIFSSFFDATGTILSESNAWEPKVAVKRKSGNLIQGPTTTTNNFLGLTDNSAVSYPSGSFFSYIPPDTYGYAGPNHLMVVLNTQYRILQKNGTVVSTIDAEDFWKGTTGYYAPPITTNVATGHSDPHVKYDPVSNRWILIAQTNADNFSSLLVAVSQTNDPTGTWNRYCIDVDAANLVMFDYPLIGFTADWIVVTGNMFTLAGGTFSDHQIYIFDKANLYAGGAITFGTNAQKITAGGTTRSGWSSPATVISGGAANTMYLLQPFFTSAGNAGVLTSSLTGAIPAVAWNFNLAFSTSPLGNFATASSVANGNTQPQKNDPVTINSGDGRFAESYQVGGNLWTTQHVYLPVTQPASRSAIQWWQLQTSGAILQNGRIDDASGKIHRAYPSIAVNAAEDVAIGYSIASLDRFVSCAYATRKACTPANQMDKEIVYKDGIDTYSKSFGGTRVRWGDYSNTCVDPTTGNFWTLQQYANTRANATPSGSRWSTWWAEITPDANNVVSWAANTTQYLSETGSTGTCPRYTDVNLTISSLCAATGAATLTVSGSGTASNISDYQILTPSITYNTGDISKTVTLRIFDDAEAELQETINLTYTISGTGVVAGTESQTVVITINDNDAAPVVQNTSGTVVLGQGNIINGVSNLPLRGAVSDVRCQFIYTAAELNAVGLKAGNVTELSLDVLQKLSTIPYSGFTIGMKNTASTNLSTTTGLESGVTTVYTGNFTSVVGTNTFILSTPFNWDGTSSLLIEMCYDNAAANSSDQVKSSTVIPAMALWKSATSGSGCALAATGSLFSAVTGLNNVRPDIRLKGALNGNPVETALVTTTVNIGANADVYVYDAAGNVQARIKNLTAFDYGCTQVQIDRAGTSSVQFWNNNAANYLASKSFKVIPTNNTTTGHYQITLYYTDAEVTGWQTATGMSWGAAQMVKVSNGFFVPDVTIATPHTSDVSIIGTSQLAYGTDNTITGDFNNTGFSGFGVGVPASPLPVTTVYFNGYQKDNYAILEWKTAAEYNNKGFELEKSFDGINFVKIGFIDGAGTSALTNNYSFTDKTKLTNVQYYRLKQIDFDFKTTISNIVTLKTDTKQVLDLISVSNPFKSTINLLFSKPLTQPINVELFDLTGKKVFTSKIPAGNLSIIEFKVPEKLSKGSYVINITEGNLKFVKQLVKL